MVKRSRGGDVRLTSVTRDDDMWKMDMIINTSHDGVRIKETELVE